MLSNHDYNFWLTIGIMAAFAVALVLWVWVMAAFEQNKQQRKERDE